MLTHHEAEVAGHLHEWAKLMRLYDSHQLLAEEIVVHAIPDAELHSFLLTCSNHAITISDRSRHRFFRDNLLLSFSSANRKLRMQCWRCNNVNNIYVSVISDAIEVFVT